ncbi:MAG: 4-hydroxy-tetrahydrodipicolinate reductase [Bacteroidales bacterium]|nr:4-hydroxy-tetrahydrodipicolinate reductase [Bacteroidales bacterium]
MKFALLGYGKMGKEIEKIALNRGHTVSLIIDVNNLHDLNPENLGHVDVAVDFTTPEVAFDNIMTCLRAGVPVVSGTTGWLEKLEDVVTYCKEKQQTFFYASNYSLGVNIFFHVNKRLAQLMNPFSSYNVSVEEIHHIRKKDAPSGTAITLANDIIALIDRKNKWELDKETEKQNLRIKAVREDDVPGTHIVTYESDVDFIEIKHVARNRQGLAYGAVLAAEFVYGKTGFFTMNDLLQF